MYIHSNEVEIFGEEYFIEVQVCRNTVGNKVVSIRYSKMEIQIQIAREREREDSWF